MLLSIFRRGALALLLMLASALPAHATYMILETSPTGRVQAPATVNVNASAWNDDDGIPIVSLDLYHNGKYVTSTCCSSLSMGFSNLPVGEHRFTVNVVNAQGGGASETASVTVYSLIPPSVTLGTPTGAPFWGPATVGLSASASDSDGSVTKVEFLANNQVVGTDTTAPYAMNWSGVAPGTYTLAARAFDNDGLSTTSATSQITVQASRVIGNIDGVALDSSGVARVRGWACSTGRNDSIDVHVYLGGPAGSGTYALAARANLASEAAVASACQASGTAYRFAIVLDNTLRHHHGGKAIHIHGISPVGQPNDLIGNSGTYAVPALNRNASFIAQTVPATVLVGQSFSASVQMRNDGNGVWYTAENYRLGSYNPHNNTTWGPSRVNLASNVGTGSTATFNIAAKAPTSPGPTTSSGRCCRRA